jgi:hypothetical protein
MRNVADEWHIQHNIASDALEVWALNRLPDGSREYITAEFSVHRVEPRSFFDRGPTLRLASDECQQLMNELWRSGFRPRDGAGSVAHVDATKAHLEDMRRLVFDKASG